MRCTERRLTPTAFAMARPVQCVTCPGGSEQVSARIFATVAVVSFAVPGGRVLSRSNPSTPASANRTCQRHTAGRLTSAWRAPRLRPLPRPTTTRSGHVVRVSAGDPVRRNRRQLLLIGITNDDANCLGHLPNFAEPLNSESSVRVSALSVDRRAYCPVHHRRPTVGRPLRFPR